ncbi:hypothetical protein [Desulfosporosinus sp. Sb-LF]|uniref:hypothetical protein n=1 Tax=Desulfosporosinus sp. Sb-LF TaxID=2560027 RepID=UPI00107F71CB|nr:hypothetical protein [Desulfosporosinus sp. Sb-LF]
MEWKIKNRKQNRILLADFQHAKSQNFNTKTADFYIEKSAVFIGALWEHVLLRMIKIKSGNNNMERREIFK